MHRNPLPTYAQWLQSWPWELFLTTRLHGYHDPTAAHDQIIAEIIRPLSLSAEVRTAAITVTIPGSDIEQPHAHSLILSRDGRLTALAEQFDAQFTTYRSAITTHENAVKILPVSSNGVCNYVANHMHHARAELFYYGDRLLKQKQQNRS